MKWKKRKIKNSFHKIFMDGDQTIKANNME